MPLIPNTTSTAPPQEEKSLDITAAVTPRSCPTLTQIGDVNQLQLGDLLDRMRIYETERCQQIITGNFCDASSISSLSVAASERDMLDDEEGIFGDDPRHENRDTKEVKPSLKRCSKNFCFVPTIHDYPSPPRVAKRMRLK